MPAVGVDAEIPEQCRDYPNLGIHGADCVGRAFETVDTGNEDVPYAPIL